MLDFRFYISITLLHGHRLVTVACSIPLNQIGRPMKKKTCINFRVDDSIHSICGGLEL